jgi:hypothetical protein
MKMTAAKLMKIRDDTPLAFRAFRKKSLELIELFSIKLVFV